MLSTLYLEADRPENCITSSLVGFLLGEHIVKGMNQVVNQMGLDGAGTAQLAFPLSYQRHSIGHNEACERWMSATRKTAQHMLYFE